jgi:8-oxo-dGTP diphosphatase
MQKEKKKVEVVAAIIRHNDKILCVQRGENKLDYISKKYEFPGGKIEAGETREQTIIREIQEELKMDISTGEDFFTVEHEYPDFFLTMHSFICYCEDPTVHLTEHVDYKWLATYELEGLDWAGADIPIVEKLIHA